MSASRKGLWVAGIAAAAGLLIVVLFQLQNPAEEAVPPAAAGPPPVADHAGPPPARDGEGFSWDEAASVGHSEREAFVQWAWLEARTLAQDVQAMALDRMNDTGEPVDIGPFFEERDAFQQAVLAARDASPEAWPEIRLRLARDWAALDATVKDLFDIP